MMGRPPELVTSVAQAMLSSKDSRVKAFSSRAGRGATKFQIPTTNIQRNFKFQDPSLKGLGAEKGAGCWTSRFPFARSSIAIELRRSRVNGLLSPTLSSKGGEGEDPDGSSEKLLNSMAVPRASPQGEGAAMVVSISIGSLCAFLRRVLNGCGALRTARPTFLALEKHFCNKRVINSKRATFHAGCGALRTARPTFLALEKHYCNKRVINSKH